jgi:hypothetical protein
MGASGWQHFVPHDADVGRALTRLREQVFESGQFFVRGPKPKTIEAALRQGREDGTHSVLDVSRVVEGPLPTPLLAWQSDVMAKTGAPPSPAAFQARMKDEMRFWGAVTSLSEAQLVSVFGSARPDHATVATQSFALMMLVPRAAGVYVVVYDAGAPSELFFAGVTGD